MTSVKEWIDDKIKDGNINYFEYDKFNNIVEIGRGGFGKVKKADLTSMGLKVALKSSIYEYSRIEENDINRLNNLVKEVRIAFFLHILALYVKFIVIKFILLLVKTSSHG